MLNQAYVLRFIKNNLQFPFSYIELTDEMIVQNFVDFTLVDFSRYVPENRKIGLNLDLEVNKVPNTQNEFFVRDPDGLDVLNVVNVIFPASNLYIHGHPPMGVFTQAELPAWTLQMDTAMQAKMFSSYDETFEFKHPNILRISSVLVAKGIVTVEYERIQHPDLSGIPNEFQRLFCQLALADAMIIIGRIRKKYGDGVLRTPFGDIPLSSEISDEGREMRRETIDRLESSMIPNIVFDKG